MKKRAGYKYYRFGDREFLVRGSFVPEPTLYVYDESGYRHVFTTGGIPIFHKISGCPNDKDYVYNRDCLGRFLKQKGL